MTAVADEKAAGGSNCIAATRASHRLSHCDLRRGIREPRILSGWNKCTSKEASGATSSRT
jgi:hypothetical protein